jgi:TRAP-type C4-dicarboxylate transport system substrate-binding protein
MKRPLTWLVAALALLLPALMAFAQGTTIKLATLVPEGSVWDQALRQTGADWGTATQNRVALKIYPGGVAGDEPDVVRKMRIGQLQAAALTTIGLSEMDPAFALFNTPMFFESYPELYAVLDQMTPVLKQRLEAKGFVLLAWGHGGWVYFFSKQPVESVEQLKRTKMFVWAGDDRMVQRWKSHGFQPVALATTDILTGLKTGMIDCLPNTPLILLSLQWFKETPNMTGVGLAPLVGGLVMTKAAWNKVAEQDRAKILASCAKLERRLTAEVPRQDTTAVAEMRKRGLNVAKVSPGNAAQFRAMAQSFAAGMRGDPIPPEILDLAQRARDQYRSRAGAAR